MLCEQEARSLIEMPGVSRRGLTRSRCSCLQTIAKAHILSSRSLAVVPEVAKTQQNIVVPVARVYSSLR